MATDIVEDLQRRAAARPRVIVYPEPEDDRILRAAARAAELGIARPLIVGPEGKLPGSPPPGVAMQAMEGGDRLDRLADAYAQRRGLNVKIARRLVSRPLFYGAMLVALGEADGMVAGISHTTASVLQAAGLAIGYAEGVAVPSSSFLMVVRELGGRPDVPLLFADCAVNVEPDAEDLADIAVAAAMTARRLMAVVPRVAMLSFSTRGSAVHPRADLVRRAAELAAQRIGDGFVEGELQLDAAVSPAVAAKKLKEPGEVAGRANVLIFPDLEAGNIAYKAVQYLGGARAVGPILQGFARPVNDLSRGASVEDVVATTAITVLQA